MSLKFNLASALASSFFSLVQLQVGCLQEHSLQVLLDHMNGR